MIKRSFQYLPPSLPSLLSKVMVGLVFIAGSIAATAQQQGLKAEYYDGTNFDRLIQVDYVANIDQSWYEESPVKGMDPHECSIRWTGKLKPQISGKYSFSAQVDDGIRVWIEGDMIIDQWELNDLGRFEGDAELKAHQEYDLKVEYFNGMFEGEVRLLWKKNKEKLTWSERLFGDGIKYTVIPAENFVRPELPALPAQEKKKVIKEKKKPLSKTKPKPKPTKVKKNELVVKTIEEEKTPEVKNEVEIEEPVVIIKEEEIEDYLPKNVQFEKGKTRILESSYPELDNFVLFMLKHTHLKVKVEGHTDVVGDAQLNLVLSKSRAKKITEYLISKGISKWRIKAEGYGGTRPLKIPEEGQYHPANRRVVFIVENP